MTAPAANTLEEVIRHSGEGWIIDSFSPAAGAMPRVRQLLQLANAKLLERLGPAANPITETAVVHEYKRSAHKIHAFIQALGQTESPEMLVMVWRILQGMEIQQIRMNYQMRHIFAMEITLVSPYGEPVETYLSNDIDDAALLRHIGIMKMDDKPIFDGFYPVPWAV